MTYCIDTTYNMLLLVQYDITTHTVGNVFIENNGAAISYRVYSRVLSSSVKPGTHFFENNKVIRVFTMLKLCMSKERLAQ